MKTGCDFQFWCIRRPFTRVEMEFSLSTFYQEEKKQNYMKKKNHRENSSKEQLINHHIDMKRKIEDFKCWHHNNIKCSLAYNEKERERESDNCAQYKNKQLASTRRLQSTAIGEVK